MTNVVTFQLTRLVSACRYGASLGEMHLLVIMTKPCRKESRAHTDLVRSVVYGRWLCFFKTALAVCIVYEACGASHPVQHICEVASSWSWLSRQGVRLAL